MQFDQKSGKKLEKNSPYSLCLLPFNWCYQKNLHKVKIVATTFLNA